MPPQKHPLPSSGLLVLKFPRTRLSLRLLFSLSLSPSPLIGHHLSGEVAWFVLGSAGGSWFLGPWAGVDAGCRRSWYMGTWALIDRCRMKVWGPGAKLNDYAAPRVRGSAVDRRQRSGRDGETHVGEGEALGE